MQRKEQLSMSVEKVFIKKKIGYVWSKVDFMCPWLVSGGTKGVM